MEFATLARSFEHLEQTNFRRVDSVSAKYVARIPVGKLRLGIGDATMLDAGASATFHETRARPLLEGAYNKTSDRGLIARTLW